MQNPDNGEMTLFADEIKALQEATRFVPVAAVFSIGEVVEVKEGKFKIVAIGKRFMRLESLPRSYDTK